MRHDLTLTYEQQTASFERMEGLKLLCVDPRLRSDNT